MPTPDHYAILKVAPNAPREAIRKAYLSLAREHHPDVAGQAGHDRMQRINAAWGVLGDVRLRADYDRTLPRARFQQAPAMRTATNRPSPQPSKRKNWRSVGVPWEERYTDWYAYFELGGNADEGAIRAAINRRRRNAEAAGDEPWAVRQRAELNRIEAILCDPVRRKAYDDELARNRVRDEQNEYVRRAAASAARGSVRYSGDPDVDWYAVLGVHSGTSAEGIRQALQAKGRELSKSKITAIAYDRERARLVEASRILSNPAMRAAYDQVRRTRSEARSSARR